MENQMTLSKTSLWSGRILKGILSLFLLTDGIMKLIKHPKYVEGTQQLGLPESCMTVLGLYLVAGTLLYIYRKTSFLGSLFLTAYLGGAAAITYAANNDGHPYLFPVIFTVILWLAEYLQNQKIRTVLSFNS